MGFLLLCQTMLMASLQWLNVILPMPEGKLGGSPGLALIGISSGSKSKSVASDCRK